MPGFNTVLWNSDCESCGQAVDREVQFRYGRIWQVAYVVGDPIMWNSGGPLRRGIGDPSAKSALVEGYVCECPTCEAVLGECEVMIVDDRIVGVRNLTGRYDFQGGDRVHLDAAFE